jgi:hypothetical protein
LKRWMKMESTRNLLSATVTPPHFLVWVPRRFVDPGLGWMSLVRESICASVVVVVMSSMFECGSWFDTDILIRAVHLLKDRFSIFDTLLALCLAQGDTSKTRRGDEWGSWRSIGSYNSTYSWSNVFVRATIRNKLPEACGHHATFKGDEEEMFYLTGETYLT